jgi:hypothetical protein
MACLFAATRRRAGRTLTKAITSDVLRTRIRSWRGFSSKRRWTMRCMQRRSAAKLVVTFPSRARTEVEIACQPRERRKDDGCTRRADLQPLLPFLAPPGPPPDFMMESIYGPRTHSLLFRLRSEISGSCPTAKSGNVWHRSAL